MNSIEQLTVLQEELGYKKGEISTVAMLGLVGEAGEVLENTCSKSSYKNLFKVIDAALKACRKVETLKKHVRADSSGSLFELDITEDDMPNFKSELGDCFYYLNILATNVGLTVFDLAQMAHDKIKRKQAEGGSSEDRRVS